MLTIFSVFISDSVSFVIAALARKTNSRGNTVQFFPLYVQDREIVQYVVFDKVSKYFFPMEPTKKEENGGINTKTGYVSLWLLMQRIHNVKLSIKSNAFVFGINIRILESHRKYYYFH